jgi:hypothetical protein
MFRKRGKNEVAPADHGAGIDPIRGNQMGGTGKVKKPLNEDSNKSNKKPPRAEDDDCEDGDIATPKRDRNGDDDEPL